MTIIAQLNGILKPEHLKYMFLTEDEDFVYLWQLGNDKPIAVFSVQTTIEEIRKEADRHVTDPRQIVMEIEGEN